MCVKPTLVRHAGVRRRTVAVLRSWFFKNASGDGRVGVFGTGGGVRSFERIAWIVLAEVYLHDISWETGTV